MKGKILDGYLSGTSFCLLAITVNCEIALQFYSDSHMLHRKDTGNYVQLENPGDHKILFFNDF